MQKTATPPRSDVSAESPLVLLATLVSARRSKDYALERLARRKLTAAGVRIIFDDERAAAAQGGK